MPNRRSTVCYQGLEVRSGQFRGIMVVDLPGKVASILVVGKMSLGCLASAARGQTASSR